MLILQNPWNGLMPKQVELGQIISFIYYVIALVQKLQQYKDVGWQNTFKLSLGGSATWLSSAFSQKSFKRTLTITARKPPYEDFKFVLIKFLSSGFFFS